MTIIEKINKQIDLFDRIEKAKQKLDNLRINWETDINKMEFDNLFSGNIAKGCEYLRMDKIKIEPNPDKDVLFESASDSLRMVNLIELIDRGVRIIPPIYVDDYVLKDGVKEFKESLLFMDGSHRQRIAAHLQLKAIPIVVFERIESYKFTPGKWEFEMKQIREEIPGGGYHTTGSYLEASSTDGKIVKVIQGKHPLYLHDIGLSKFIEISAH